MFYILVMKLIGIRFAVCGVRILIKPRTSHPEPDVACHKNIHNNFKHIEL
jgi:hypothetical protein